MTAAGLLVGVASSVELGVATTALSRIGDVAGLLDGVEGKLESSATVAAMAVVHATLRVAEHTTSRFELSILVLPHCRGGSITNPSGAGFSGS